MLSTLVKLMVFVLLSTSVFAEEDAMLLFKHYQDRIFQIRLVDLRAEKKIGLGSGFLASQDGLVATNFHVISKLVHFPKKYRAEMVNSEGVVQQLQLVDIDILNDLALLQASVPEMRPLDIPDKPSQQGDTIYSIGNPYDIGFTVVPGTFNGLDENSYYPRIHFSGSVNPGMSGGPVLNRNGEVVGINVSTAGNQISFLIPGAPLRALLDRQHDKEFQKEQFGARIRNQLLQNQKHLFNDLLAQDWPVEMLGEAQVVGEMPPFVKCWGESSKEKDLYRSISTSCRSKQSIYLDDRFNTGVISYQFLWLEAGELSDMRFRSFYSSIFGRFYPDNRVDEENVGNFVCEEHFIEDNNNTDKLVICARAYRKYAGLYDLLYLRGAVDQSSQAFISHFTLAGVDLKSMEAFLRRFMEVVKR